jgi:hypothetical protein
MPGAYCQFCDTRCFVLRQIYVDGKLTWTGHLATCERGKQHDREVCGQDADTAFNPYAPGAVPPAGEAS